MNEKTTIVAAYDDPMEAHIARGRLEDSGISCQLEDDGIATTYGLLANAVGGVKLRILEDDLEHALELLNSTPDGHLEDSVFGDEFEEEDEVETRRSSSSLTCPKCAGEEIGFGTVFHIYWSAVLLLLGASLFIPAIAHYTFLAMATMIFVGFWLAILRQFPLRCKDCDEQGPRKLFDGAR
ncbi:MAG: DUF2007 domain-containing protein [Bradymonadaceae bacterium]